MNAGEHLLPVAEVAFDERHMGGAVEAALEDVDDEIAMLRRELGGGHQRDRGASA